MIRRAILLLALLVPVAGAQNNPDAFDEATWGAGATGDVREYSVFTRGRSASDPPVGDLLNVTFDHFAKTTLPIRDSDWFLRLSYTETHQTSGAGVGVWRYRTFVNNVEVPLCRYEIETFAPGILGGTPAFMTNLLVFCQLPDLVFGTNRISVVRNSQSGSPAAIQQDTLGVEIRRVDLVVTDLETDFEMLVGLTAWEFAAIVVVIVLGLMVNARGRDLGAKSVGGLILLLAGLVCLQIRNVWVGGVEFAAVVLLVAGYAFVRAALDYLEERRVKTKKTDPGGPI